MSNNPLDISKALTTQPDSTGDILVPEVVTAGIREYFEKRTPLWNQFRKETAESNAIGFRDQLSIPVASFGAEMGALPAAQNATYAERAVMLKSIYTRGEISGQLIAATRSELDVLQREIRNHTLGMVNTLENTLVVGDSDARPNEFDGLDKWITNEVSLAPEEGDAPGLTLNHLELMRDSTTTGMYNLLIMDSATRRRLWSVLQPQVRFIGETEIEGGFKVAAYNGTPIIETRPTTSEARAAMANKILGVNTDMIWIPVLQDLTYEELAHTRDSTDFMLKMYVGMIVEGGAAFHTKLTGFSSDVA